MPRYKVIVDDNYHFADADGRWERGVYETAAEALEVCRRLVDLTLAEGYEAEMSAASLFGYYKSYGDDPFIVVLDGEGEEAKFSAWDYAKARSIEMCSAASAGDADSRGPIAS